MEDVNDGLLQGTGSQQKQRRLPRKKSDDGDETKVGAKKTKAPLKKKADTKKNRSKGKDTELQGNPNNTESQSMEEPDSPNNAKTQIKRKKRKKASTAGKAVTKEALSTKATTQESRSRSPARASLPNEEPNILDEKRLLATRTGRIKNRTRTGQQDPQQQQQQGQQRDGSDAVKKVASKSDSSKKVRRKKKPTDAGTVPVSKRKRQREARNTVVPGAQAISGGEEDESDAGSQDSLTRPGALLMEGVNAESNAFIEEIEATQAAGSQGDENFIVEAELVEEGQSMTQEQRAAIEMETRQKVIDEMTGNVAQAEVVVGGDDRNKRQAIVLSVCCCLVIIVVTILGSVLGTRNNRNRTENENPIPTEAPSAFPTITPLNNSFCEEAIPVGLGGSSNKASIFGSLEDVYTMQYVLHCENIGNPWLDQSVGLWYKFVANDDGPASARIVSQGSVGFNVYILEDLADCFGTCIDNTFYGGGGIAWPTVRGEEYYILIYADSPGEGDLAFELVLDDNDTCDMAFGPLPPNGFHVGAIAADASVDSQFIGKCSNEIDLSENPGVWYIVIGDGALISASTCTATSMDTKIFVFRGNSCDQLECVDWNDDSCGRQSLVVWSSIPNEIYYVLVSGTVGSFSLELRSENTNPLASGDFCLNAQGIVGGGGPILLDFSDATQDADVNDNRCYYYPDPDDIPVGIWFKVSGTGQEMVAVIQSPLIEDLCSTFLSIYSGSSCEDLECVLECSGECTWLSVQGQVYYVFVNYHEGIGGPTGEVTLSVS